MLKEWPLVAFTILGQMAVGAFLLLCPLLFLSPVGASWGPTARAMVLVVWGTTLGLITIAVSLSLFHLHHPLRARRVLANIRTSWLSREILFELAFTAFVALAFILVWTGHTTGPFLRAVIAAGAVTGILFLISMGRLYILKSVPPWDSAYIGMSFFLTAVILGAMATASVTRSPWGYERSYFSALWTAALFFIAADVLFAAFVSPVFGLVGYRPKPSLRPPARVPLLLHLGRLGLLLGGLILMVLSIFADAAGTPGGFGPAMIRPEGGPGPLLTLAFALVLAGEVAGRFLFYGLAPRAGD
jgi:anaerobic dimethyl sulfoxide reductase subunit C (anchor subunit)